MAAMLELMEKLQAGAPAISEQLFSSCRLSRASENSLWQERTGGPTWLAEVLTSAHSSLASWLL